MTGAVLAPLAARYASWLDASVDEVVRESEQRSTQVRALQLILRLERDPVPSWHRALSLAAAAAGADGIIVEVHPRPAEALSDGQQALTFSDFDEMMSRLDRVLSAMDRPLQKA